MNYENNTYLLTRAIRSMLMLRLLSVSLSQNSR